MTTFFCIVYSDNMKARTSVLTPALRFSNHIRDASLIQSVRSVCALHLSVLRRLSNSTTSSKSSSNLVRFAIPSGIRFERKIEMRSAVREGRSLDLNGASLDSGKFADRNVTSVLSDLRTAWGVWTEGTDRIRRIEDASNRTLAVRSSRLTLCCISSAMNWIRKFSG